MTPLRKWLRRLRTLLWTALTLVTITAAVVVGVGKLLMPYSVRYKPQLEVWLEREFNQPVELHSFTGEWKAFGPRITLEGLSLLGEQGGGDIAIQLAALDIKPLNALLAGRPLYTFRIIGADLSLVRTVDGRFELSGLGVSGRGGDGSGLSNLARVGEVRLEDSQLSFDDAERAIHLQLTRVNGALQLKGNELALEVEASVTDPRTIRVLGDLGITALVELNDDRRLSAARWHIKTGELMVSEFGRQLPEHALKPLSGWLNAELWGSWSPQEGQRMEGVLDIREMRMNTEEGLAEVDHLNALFRWRFQHRRQWRMDLAEVQVEESGRSWSSPRITVERNIEGGLGVWVSADAVEAELPLLITHQAMGSFNARWPRVVPRKGRGAVSNFDLVISADKQLVSASAEFTDLEAWDWPRFPGIAGVSGRADMAWGEGVIELAGSDVRIDWPGQFRVPAVVDIPACSVGFGWGEGWQVDVHECVVENDRIRLNGRTRFAGNEGKPAMDINVAVERASLAGLHDYWPRQIMKPNITGWLERAVRGGEVTQGRFLLQGDMDDWPFRGGEGTLAARLSVNDGRLDYQPGWPAAAGVDAVVEFSGVGMTIEGSAKGMGGAPLDRVSARIADLQTPILTLDYSTRAELPALVSFIDATPLLDGSRLDLGQFTFEGAADTTGQLVIPLGQAAEGLRLEGRLQLADNGFTEGASQVRLEGLAGTVDYHEAGLSATGLDALWTGFPASVDLAADWDAETLFRADLAGRFPIDVVLAASPISDDPLLRAANGDTDWQFSVVVTQPEQPDSDSDVWLGIESDLTGVALGLPSPLDKPRDAPMRLRLDYPIQSANPWLTASLGQDLLLRMEVSPDREGVQRAAFLFGPGEPVLPEPGTFDITGQIDRFDLDTWIDVVVDAFAEDPVREGLEFGQARLGVDALTVLNRSFADVRLDAHLEDDVLFVHFDSEALAGDIRYSRVDDGAHSLTAELDRLLMPDPVDDGMTMDSDPTDLPEMHLYVKQFRYLGMDMGETRIEAYPIADGLRIDSVEAVSPELTFQARGDWTLDDAGSRSDFDIVMTSESLGSLVTALDLSSVLEGGQTMVRFDADWPGPPAAFALARLNGDMSFSIIDGNILNADPGAGRVLGLVSLTALPRRLALDFRDVFDTGFNFDQASGNIRLENGTAHTDDFLLESTAATLSIVGNSNLVEQRFDYEMAVRPGVSQALPVIGALAAGPGGAAAGLALQGLLKEALGEAAEARYAITGTWDEPEVVRLASEDRGTDHFPDTAADDLSSGPAEDTNDND